MKKIELIITNNTVLQEEIEFLTKSSDSSSVATFYINNNIEIESFLQKHIKIDLVIIDSILEISSLNNITKISKAIVNMTPNNVSEHYINLTKPFRIKNLIDIINKSRNSKLIYEVICDNMIFNEESSVIFDISSEKNILLTEKENMLIAKLFLATNHMMSKEEILRDIWGYSNNSETSTLETHISRLKSKLPDDFLNSKDGNIRLSITMR